MSSAQERLAAQLNAQFSPPGKREEDKPAPATRPSAATKHVRRTVDLPRGHHHELTKWCDEQALVLGVARVPGQVVLAELVALLLRDETTARKVHEALRKKYEEG